MRPSIRFSSFDESTSALDEKLEAQLYSALARRLAGTTIASIGHRSAVVGLQQRHLEMIPDADHYTLRDASKSVPAGR